MERGDTLLRLFRERGCGPQISSTSKKSGFSALVPTSSDDRSFQAAGIPNVSLGMNETIASHQMWLVLNAGNQSGFRPDFVPDLFQVIHTGEDTIERVSGAAMTRLHEAIVALVLELDRAL